MFHNNKDKAKKYKVLDQHSISEVLRVKEKKGKSEGDIYVAIDSFIKIYMTLSFSVFRLVLCKKDNATNHIRISDIAHNLWTQCHVHVCTHLSAPFVPSFN